MKKNFMYKFLISFFVIFAGVLVYAEEITFVSLSPALTETMYVLGADYMLKGVSNSCTYPVEAKNKEKIGDSYFVNYEKIIKLKHQVV